MGMTIDEAEAIEILKDVWLNANYIQNRESLTGMACKLAIETMRKYQKIKEQVDIAIDKENFAISGARLIQIREIINGNDD